MQKGTSTRIADPNGRELRVLFLSFSPRVHGGADRSLLLLVEGLAARGSRPLLVVPGEGELNEEAARKGLDVEVLDLMHVRGSRIRDFVRGLWQLRRLCRRRRVDLIHCNAWTALQWAVPVAATLGLPVVCHFRGLHFSRKRLMVCLLNRCEAIIAVSSAVKDCLVEAGVRAGVVTVVHNAVDLSLDGPRSEPRCEPGDCRKSVVVGMASQLIPWKGHRYLLCAAARIVQRHPNVEFRIAGDAWPDDPAYVAELRDLVRRLGLQQHVRFLGFLKEIAPFMRSLDLLVLPSDHEPFGRVLIEAMAASKPVVAFRGGGVAEIVDHEVNGLLVAHGDVEGLANAIGRLVCDPMLAAAMGRAGRVKAQTCFSRDKHVREIEEIHRFVAGISS